MFAEPACKDAAPVSPNLADEPAACETPQEQSALEPGSPEKNAEDSNSSDESDSSGSSSN